MRWIEKYFSRYSQGFKNVDDTIYFVPAFAKVMKIVPVKYLENIFVPNNNYKADTAMAKAVSERNDAGLWIDIYL